MPDKKSRFVLVCQQLLVFGTVAALATPALGVVTLDIVSPHADGAADVAARGPASTVPVALVASEPVEPEVTDVPLGGVAKAGLEALPPGQAKRHAADEDLAVLSAPEEVEGYATVGVTWDSDVHLEEDEVSVEVRTLQDGEWSGWETIEYHDEHAPDPDSAEARRARPGTEPIVVGDVDEVQVRIETEDGRAPADAELAIVDPKATPDPQLEEPAIDTAALDAPAVDTASVDDAEAAIALSSTSPDPGTGTEADPDPVDEPIDEPGDEPVDGGFLAAGGTPKPTIFSRAQWGADERMRDGSPSYHEVHAGFVHHTVNANSYTREQVPSLMRGIYAYHTQSRGWSDIGYNFIVDRFGRIWEGRYGGVDRPVVGAHTLGYNEYSFAMSALGNFDTAQPPAAMLDAYGRLFAWKLSLHGVSANDTSQRVGSRTFPAINGHRDAGSTACPGRYLYAKLGTIRSLASQYQKPFTSRDRRTQLAGSGWPDMAVRDAATKKLYVLRTGGQANFLAGNRTSGSWSGMDLIASGADITGDRIPDVIARTGSTGTTQVFPGTSTGSIGQAVKSTIGFRRADQMLLSRDLTGDGNSDVVARTSGAYLFLYPGNGAAGFRQRILLSGAWSGYDLTAPGGDLDGDGRVEILARSQGRLSAFERASSGLGAPRLVAGTWGQYSTISGGADLTGDGHHDLLVRVRSTGDSYIVPGKGNGTFGSRLGPFTRFRGANHVAVAGQLVGSRHADVIARRSDGTMHVHAHNGRRNVEALTDTGYVLSNANLILNVGDWNGDGVGDLVTRATGSTGVMHFRAGTGNGGFAAPVTMTSGWANVVLVAAVGDITGDGHPDLMGQPSGGAMRIYPGDGRAGFLSSYVARSAISGDRHTGVGLWNGDGSPDTLVRRTDGTLHVYPGNGPGGLVASTQVGAGAAGYDWLQSPGDATGDGHPDLIGRERSTGKLWLLPGTGAGFSARRLLAEGFGRFDLGS